MRSAPAIDPQHVAVVGPNVTYSCLGMQAEISARSNAAVAARAVIGRQSPLSFLPARLPVVVKSAPFQAQQERLRQSFELVNQDLQFGTSKLTKLTPC